MTIAILTQFNVMSDNHHSDERGGDIRSDAYGDLRDNDNTSDFVEGCGQQGDQAACTYVNIPGLQ